MLGAEEWRKRYKEEREIKCPKCGKIQGNDDCQYPISYHGNEDGPIEFECDNDVDECDAEFLVEETVERTYMVFKDRKAYDEQYE